MKICTKRPVNWRNLMRIGMLQWVFIGCMAGFSQARESHAQVVLNRDVTLNLTNVTLKQALTHLQTQTGVKFVYSSKIGLGERVSVTVVNDKLGNVLDHLFQPLNIRYQVRNEQIVLAKRKEKSVQETPAVLESSTPQLPVDLAITGRVSDEAGAGLPGVNISVKNTSRGSTTDGTGAYRLAVPDERAVLVFSSVGYQKQEITVGNQTTLNVTMRSEDLSLSEVVVVGYGTQNRADVTSAIASVKGKELANVPVTNLDAALQGKAPGVQVVQNSGAPGDETYIRIRGNGSLFGENRPLYVIDGVPMNNLAAGPGPQNPDGQRNSTQNDINLNDIESVEILKDAAAAAIYGSRAGNGVILITTKKGVKGRSKFNFGMYTGVAQVVRRLDLLNGDQYVDLINEARTNAGLALDADIVKTGNNTNWQDAIFRDAPISNYNLSISGGTDRSSHFISAGYFDQQGTVIGQRFKRFNARVNFDFKATDRLKFGVNLTGSYSINNRVNNNFSGQSLMALALTQNPNNPVYNANGTYYRDSEGRLNPVMLAKELRFKSLTNRYIGNVYGQYDLAKGLILKTSLGFDNLLVTDDIYQSKLVNNGGNASGSASVYSVLLWVLENTLSYGKTFGGKHHFSALLGQSMQQSGIRRFGLAGNTSSTDLIQSVSGFTNRTEASDYRSSWGIVSYFGRAGYRYEDRYLLETALRVDGSSRFGTNKKFGYFPSVSAGWRLSNESFMKNVKFLSDLKLRASIGLTGNNEGLGNDFPSLATYSTGSNYGALAGISPNSLSNADLSWEATTQTNVGLDLSLLNNRVTFIADAYQKTTNDLIFKLELPYTSGFSRTFGANIGQLQNKGLEFLLSTRNLVGAFTWTTEFNLSINRNKITYLPLTVEGNPSSADFTEGLPNSFSTTGPVSIFRVGEPVGSFFGYRHQGVVPETGDYRFEDINGDGLVNSVDRQILGNALPKHTGGLTNTFGYKGLDLSVFLQWSYGNQVYNQTRNVLERMSSFNNSNTNTLRRWTPQNVNTDVPRAFWGDPAGTDGRVNAEVSQRFIEDGSFLRVKNVTLGYNLPTSLLKRVYLTNARLYLSAQNLLTFTNYSGYDPEVQNQQVKNSQLGIDWVTQPQPRTFMAGLNIGF